MRAEDWILENEEVIRRNFCTGCDKVRVKEYGRDEPPEEVCPADLNPLDDWCAKSWALEKITEIINDANDEIEEVLERARHS